MVLGALMDIYGRLTEGREGWELSVRYYRAVDAAAEELLRWAEVLSRHRSVYARPFPIHLTAAACRR